MTHNAMTAKFAELSLAVGGSHYPTINPHLQQQFGEAIVRECIDIAEQTRYDGSVVAERIRFVFGIEK